MSPRHFDVIVEVLMTRDESGNQRGVTFNDYFLAREYCVKIRYHIINLILCINVTYNYTFFDRKTPKL